MSRPSGWSAKAATASCRCCRRARSASSRWTKRTASASGATTSGPSTASSDACASCCPASASTPTRPRPPRASGATSPRSSALNDPLEFVGSFDRPNLLYRVLPRATLKRQLLDVLDRHRREAGHHLLHVAPGGRRARRVADRARHAGAALSRGPLGRGAQPQPGRVPQRARRRHRRHRGVRHGHRPIGRAVRRARRARRGRSSTTSRNRGAPDATASRPSAC